MAFKGFRAGLSGNQNIAASTLTRLAFTDVAFDTEGGLSGGAYVVPAGLNGAYMVFSAASLFPNDRAEIMIRISTDGGANWITLARNNTPGPLVSLVQNIVSGPVQVSTGDIVEVLFVTYVSGNSVTDATWTFFGGYVVPGAFYGFRASKNADVGVGGRSLHEVTFGNVLFDSLSAYDGSSRYVVPASLGGAWMEFFASLEWNSSEEQRVEIQRSSDNFATWATLAEEGIDHCAQANVSTGPVQVSAGDEIRVLFNPDGGTTLRGDNDYQTSFSGFVIGALP